MSKQSFIDSMFPYAQSASSKLQNQGINVDPKYIVAHWAHETGYGINTGAKRNNYAGIYAYPTSPYGINGKSYSDINDFVDDYVNTLSNKRYAKNINNASSVTEFASGLKAGGYASDPRYAYSKNWTEAFNLASGGGSNSPSKLPTIPDSESKNIFDFLNPLSNKKTSSDSVSPIVSGLVKAGIVVVILFLVFMLFRQQTKSE